VALQLPLAMVASGAPVHLARAAAAAIDGTAEDARTLVKPSHHGCFRALPMSEHQRQDMLVP
jgi:hypothetical protein